MKTDLGNVNKEKDGFKVVFERTLNHPISKVWEAITNPEKLKVWFTDFEMELKPHSQIRIIFRDKANTITTGKVIEVKPPHRFVWSWEDELAVWELTELENDRCTLRLAYSKLNEPNAVGASAGFHSLLERLQKYLQGNSTTYPFGTEEFDPEQIELREVYGEKVYDRFPELEQYHPVKMDKIYPVSTQEAWNALTDNEQLKQWYFDFKGNFKLEVGHVFEWEAGPPQGRQWLHRGKMLDIVEGKKIVHSWEFPGYSGEAKLTWTISALDPDRTLLTLEFEFITPFDFTEEALRRKNFVQGWKQILSESLKNHLRPG